MQIVSNGDKSYPLETICMKCLILFSGKIKKYIYIYVSSELAQRMVYVYIDNFLILVRF